MAGYHIKEISNGILGDFSKIKEEFLEFEDSIEQSAAVMALIELSDLVGAIEAFYIKNQSQELFDIMMMSVKNKDVEKLIDCEKLKNSFLKLEQAVNKNDYSKFEFFFQDINCYVRKYNLTINDLCIMSKITKRAFVSGSRPSKS